MVTKNWTNTKIGSMEKSHKGQRYPSAQMARRFLRARRRRHRGLVTLSSSYGDLSSDKSPCAVVSPARVVTVTAEPTAAAAAKIASMLRLVQKISKPMVNQGRLVQHCLGCSQCIQPSPPPLPQLEVAAMAMAAAARGRGRRHRGGGRMI